MVRTKRLLHMFIASVATILMEVGSEQMDLRSGMAKVRPRSTRLAAVSYFPNFVPVVTTERDGGRRELLVKG